MRTLYYGEKVIASGLRLQVFDFILAIIQTAGSLSSMDARCIASLTVNLVGLVVGMALVSAGFIWAGLILFAIMMLFALAIA